MTITQQEITDAVKAAGWSRAARNPLSPPNVIAVHQGLEVRVLRIEPGYVRLYGPDLVDHKDLSSEDVVPDGCADDWEAAAITVLLQQTPRTRQTSEATS